LWDETRTPLEKYNAELERLDALQKRGADGDLLARGRAKAMDDFEKATESDKGGTYEPARILQAGGADAASFLARSLGGGQSAQEQMAKRQERTNELLGQVAKNTAKAATGGLSVAQLN
jgi:hypothetical protein